MPTAEQFLTELEALRTPTGIRMGAIFALAKENTDMQLGEVKKLLAHTSHEARVGAVSIMDFKARNAKTPLGLKKDVFDLYIHNHALIDTWDLVDRSAIYVVGGYLADKPRDILYTLARSADTNQRRTAAIATLYFLMKLDQVDDSFKIAQILVNEKEQLTQSAVGWVLREAGKRDQKRLIQFLDKHAATMPRIMLRQAIEKLEPMQREHYRRLKAQ